MQTCCRCWAALKTQPIAVMHSPGCLLSPMIDKLAGYAGAVVLNQRGDYRLCNFLFDEVCLCCRRRLNGLPQAGI